MKFKYANIAILILFIAFLSTGCGSSGGGGDSTTTGGGEDSTTTSGGGATESLALPDPDTIPSIPADGASSIPITATMTDSAGNAVAQGTSVTFSTTLGTFSGGSTSKTISTTDDTGVVVVSLIAGTTAGSATVTATSNSVTQNVTVEFTGGGEASVASIQLSASPLSVKSDNSNSSTIIATALDTSNAVMQGITVSFSADGGQISDPSAVTDSDGKAVITFKLGDSDPSNKVVTITATASSHSKTVQVQVVGSTLTLTTDNTTITDDGVTQQATLTITAKDYGGNPVSGSAITLSVSGAGGAVLSADSGNTDQDGKLEVKVTGTVAGSVSVETSGLGTTESQTYTVSAPASAFGIISPTDDPYSLTTADTDTVIITVNAPALSTVRFATSLGTLTGMFDGETGTVIAESVVGGTGKASAIFSSSQAGLATVQVYDPNNPSMSDTIGIAVTAPVTYAARVQLQSSAYVLKPSVEGVTYTATLTANVRTKDLQVVGDAPVVFSIENPTGGGESISPVVVYTNGSGIATTTFTSGSLSSVFPVIVSARVVAEGTTGPLTNISFNNWNPDTITRTSGSFIDDGFEDGEQIRVKGSTSNDGVYYLSNVSAPELKLEDTKTLSPESAGATVTITAVCGITDPGITIGETAGSVVVGRGTVITKSDDDTYYSLPMSVLVADPNGNPVSGATVSLSAWPVQCSTGAWYDSDPDPEKEKFVVYISGTFNNEDENENVFLDPGEDTNADGNLTPPNSAGGTLPLPVTTDENGVASFNLVYLKAHAVWITDRIRASTMVLGTEVSSSITFRLPCEKVEAEAGDLPDSPWPIGLTVAAGGTAIYTFPVFTGSAVDKFTQSLQSGSSFTIIPGPPVIYTPDYTFDLTAYTPGVSVNDEIWDYITVEGGVVDPDSGVTSSIYTIVPVRIIVQ